MKVVFICCKSRRHMRYAICFPFNLAYSLDFLDWNRNRKRNTAPRVYRMTNDSLSCCSGWHFSLIFTVCQVHASDSTQDPATIAENRMCWSVCERERETLLIKRKLTLWSIFEDAPSNFWSNGISGGGQKFGICRIKIGRLDGNKFNVC